jgi:hypothetical protein
MHALRWDSTLEDLLLALQRLSRYLELSDFLLWTKFFSLRLASAMRFAGSATRPFAHVRYVSHVSGFSSFATHRLRVFPLRYVAASPIFSSSSPPTAVKYVLYVAAYSRYLRRLFSSYVVRSFALICTRFVCNIVEESIDRPHLRPSRSLGLSPASSARSAAIQLRFHFSSTCRRKFSISTSRSISCGSSADAADSLDLVGETVSCRFGGIAGRG